jgi:hypothetical protein
MYEEDFVGGSPKVGIHVSVREESKQSFHVVVRNTIEGRWERRTKRESFEPG